MEGASSATTQIITALNTAAGTVVTDALSAITTILPTVAVLFGAFVVIRVGMRVIHSFT